MDTLALLPRIENSKKLNLCITRFYITKIYNIRQIRSDYRQAHMVTQFDKYNIEHITKHNYRHIVVNLYNNKYLAKEIRTHVGHKHT